MKLTTLCYIEKDDKYLMIHRIKKKHDVNKDKWIGIGGKFERGESPEDCILRETKEETGLTLTSYRLRGVLTFVYNDDDAEMEYIFLYTADGFTGELADCNEGTLEWVPKTEIDSLNLWEGDRIFHRLLGEEAPFFSLKLRYQDDLLKEAVLDGKPLELLDLLDENGEPSGQVRERTLVHLNTDFEGYATIHSKTKISLAMGEREYSTVALRELIGRRALDLWQPDLIRLGGVEAWRDSAALANAYNIPVLPHYYKDYDVPLLCTVANPYGAESFDWIDAIIDNPMVIDNGFARPREGEGWGFRFLHEFMTEVKG